MICHNSVGYDAQIKDLLIKSAFNMDKKEIDAWMKYQYDPQHLSLIHISEPTRH